MSKRLYFQSFVLMGIAGALLPATDGYAALPDNNQVQMYLSSQEKFVGRVVDSNGEALPGVSVYTKDYSWGTATDIDGRFILPKSIKPGTALVFSSVGMRTVEIVYKSQSSLQIKMEEDVTLLEDVVVTGFQTISRERSTGSVSIVKKDELDKVQAPNLASKLEGVTPGLTSYNGNMSIRGISSFSINSTPLLVLDGQPVTGVNLNELNPDDIETITVLKDAAAASLYGVRASNGVIVVTTKRGTTEKPNVSVSANFYMNPAPSLDYQHYASTSDIIDYEQSYLLGNPSYQKDPLAYFEELNSMKSPKYLTQVDRLYYQMAKGEISQEQLNSALNGLRGNDYRREYQDALVQMNFIQDYNLSISKGGEKSNFFFSARYMGESTGLDNGDKNDRFNFYLKNELNLAKWFKLTLGANTALANSSYTQAGYLGATSAMPYDRLFNSDGTPAYIYPYNYYVSESVGAKEGLQSMQYNAMEEAGKNRQAMNDLYWKLFTHADFNLLKGLKLGVKFQYENRGQNTERYDEADSYYMRSLVNQYAVTNPNGGYTYYIPQGGRLAESHANWQYLNLRAQLDYETIFNEKHGLTALLGGEVREDKYRLTQSERYGYDDMRLTYQQVDWNTLNSTGVVGQLSENTNRLGEQLNVSDVRHRYVSAYFNVGYAYDSRYTLNASVRVEQADLFGTDPKYRYRPLWSLGASWNLSNEEFMKSVSWVNMLKLRMTYGITGNVDQSSSPYLLGSYITSPYSGANLTNISTPPNALLRWEKTSTFNFGVDFILFQKLTGSVDYYNRYSSDLLANKSLDPSMGFEQARVNNGAMRNSGVEFNLSYDWLDSKEWGLNTTLTASYNHNKIKKIGFTPTDAIDMMQSPTDYYLAGDTYNSLYAYRYAGLTSEGNPSVYDAEGNIVSLSPVRDINALVCVGQLDPKWSGALDVNVRWKSMSLFTKIVYYTGHTLRVDATPLYQGVRGEAQHGAIHEDIVDRWTPENTDTDIPSMNVYGLDAERTYHWKYADYNTASASFVKIRNIGMAYALPQQWIKKAGLKAVSLRAQVNNPLYWAANDRDIDPEAFNANAGVRSAQQVTSYILGVNINF